MGKCCVSGCGDMVIKGRSFTLNGHTFKEGDVITLGDGTRGLIYKGALKLKPASLEGDFKVFVQWCQEVKRLGVACERGHACGCEQGARVRRGGRRSVPHGAHVLRGGPH